MYTKVYINIDMSINMHIDKNTKVIIRQADTYVNRTNYVYIYRCVRMRVRVGGTLGMGPVSLGL